MRTLIVLFLLRAVTLAASGQEQSILVRNLDHEAGQPAAVVQIDSAPLPVYPGELLRANITGDVEVRFLVREDGSVSDVSIVSQSQREFGDPTKEAVTKWKFLPTRDRKTGKPVPIWMRCSLVFKLGFEDGLPTFFPEFSRTHLSGHEVLNLALAATKKEGLNMDAYTGFAYPQIVVVESKDHRVMWGVTWTKKNVFGEFIRVWIYDQTKETRMVEHRKDGDFTFPDRRVRVESASKKPNQAPEPTPTSVTPPAAQESRRP